MTKTYNITSKAGADMGEWQGETKAEALYRLHQEADYPAVKYDLINDEIVFPDDDTARLCGDVADWHITETTAA